MSVDVFLYGGAATPEDVLLTQPIAISAITASLVCGNITIASVLGGVATITTAVDGEPAMEPALSGAPRVEKCA